MLRKRLISMAPSEWPYISIITMALIRARTYTQIGDRAHSSDSHRDSSAENLRVNFVNRLAACGFEWKHSRCTASGSAVVCYIESFSSSGKGTLGRRVKELASRVSPHFHTT